MVTLPSLSIASQALISAPSGGVVQGLGSTEAANAFRDAEADENAAARGGGHFQEVAASDGVGAHDPPDFAIRAAAFLMP